MQTKTQNLKVKEKKIDKIYENGIRARIKERYIVKLQRGNTEKTKRNVLGKNEHYLEAKNVCVRRR